MSSSLPISLQDYDTLHCAQCSQDSTAAELYDTRDYDIQQSDEATPDDLLVNNVDDRFHNSHVL